MASAQQSSVIFNLEEIMKLERDRVAAEQMAVEAARTAAARQQAETERLARERSEQAERAAQQRARAEQEYAARLQAEREAALLRTRLEAEARERLEQAKLALDHERELQRVRASTAAAPGAARGWAVAFAALVLLGASGYAGWLQPSLQREQQRAAAAQRAAAMQAEQASSLRARLAALQAESAARSGRAVSSAATSAPDAVQTRAAQPAQSRRLQGTKTSRQDRIPSGARALDGVDVTDPDPLKGLFEPRVPRRK